MGKKLAVLRYHPSYKTELIMLPPLSGIDHEL
jgi:hypothetical protein